MSAAPWDPYPSRTRALERRAARRTDIRERHDVSPITDLNAVRTWAPGERVNDEQIDFIYMLLEDYGKMSQHELSENLAEFFGYNMGTARGITTGALFFLLSVELIEWKGQEITEGGRPSKVFSIKE